MDRWQRSDADGTNPGHALSDHAAPRLGGVTSDIDNGQVRRVTLGIPSSGRMEVGFPSKSAVAGRAPRQGAREQMTALHPLRTFRPRHQPAVAERPLAAPSALHAHARIGPEQPQRHACRPCPSLGAALVASRLPRLSSRGHRNPRPSPDLRDTRRPGQRHGANRSALLFMLVASKIRV
jgi:hypothetical protein